MSKSATMLPSPALTMFAPIEKISAQDDGTIIVDCVVSTEAVDDQNEVVTYEAIQKAAADYMTWANVREMHQPSAVGTTLELHLDDVLRKVTAQLHVVDPTAVLKVNTGVYKGVSIGGRKLQLEMGKVAGKAVKKVTEILWNELSLADRPSNGGATLLLAKRSDATEEVPVNDETPAAETAPTEIPGSEAQTPVPAVDGSEAAIAAAAPDDTPSQPAEATPDASATPVETPPAEPVLAQAAATGDLAKSAADDVRDAAWILSDLNRLIETEAAEGDTEGVAQLKAAQASLVTFVGTESAEVGTPEDVLEAEAEKPVEVVVVGSVPMYYAAVTGDLAKIAAARVSGTVPSDEALARASQMHDLAIAAGATCETTGADEALMQKIATDLSTRFGTVVRKDELDAAVGEMLGAMGPIQELLAKVAAQPVGGGPIRYPDGRFSDLAKRLDEGGHVPADVEEEVLAKLAASEPDPQRKALLGEMAATASAKNIRAAGPGR